MAGGSTHRFVIASWARWRASPASAATPWPPRSATGRAGTAPVGSLSWLASARKALGRLDRCGAMRLPALTPASEPGCGSTPRAPCTPPPMTLAQVHGELSALGPVEVVVVESPEHRAVYSRLMQHHPLGEQRLCGAQMRYLLRSTQGWLGACTAPRAGAPAPGMPRQSRALGRGRVRCAQDLGRAPEAPGLRAGRGLLRPRPGPQWDPALRRLGQDGGGLPLLRQPQDQHVRLARSPPRSGHRAHARASGGAGGARHHLAELQRRPRHRRPGDTNPPSSAPSPPMLLIRLDSQIDRSTTSGAAPGSAPGGVRVGWRWGGAPPGRRTARPARR